MQKIALGLLNSQDKECWKNTWGHLRQRGPQPQQLYGKSLKGKHDLTLPLSIYYKTHGDKFLIFVFFTTYLLIGFQEDKW